MEIKSKVLGIALVSLFLCTLFLGIATSGNGTNGYDPWVDYDESGNVDYMDLYHFAQAYETSGDPTKDVNVTNWPAMQNVNITNSYYEWYVPNWLIMNFNNQNWEKFFSTKGYGQVTIGIQTNLTVNVQIWAYIGWEYFSVEHFLANPFSELRTYEVQGDQILVRISTYDLQNTAQVYLGIYMTTSGVSKNVNVTNWPLDEQGNLKVKMTNSYYEVKSPWPYVTIHWLGSVNFRNSTAGYNTIWLYVEIGSTVRITVTVTAGSYDTNMYTLDYFDLTGPIGGIAKAWKSYDVRGTDIQVWITNTDTSRDALVSYYMYVTT
jgi:hypothetical protein